MKSKKTSTITLTPHEQIRATNALGVFLPRDCRRRYEKLHAKKVLEQRRKLSDDNWQQRCFPR